MLNQIVNRLQGQVRIRVETPFPERVLNLCGARNLAFWDMEWESETAFTCRLNRRDYYALRRAVKQLDCRLTVVRKEGVPFFLGRFRRRHALLAGLTLCSALLFFGSFFIWDFTVEGNQRVTDEEILRALQRQGVGIGTFGISLDTEDIRNHVLLEIPELLWITVNVSGCRAYVEVRERVEAPEPVDEREPTNVVARRDGLILDIQAIQTVIENRTYEKSPNGLAYWGQANNKLILKLNIPAIITEIIKNSQQQIDGELINGITEAILKTDPIRLKSLLSTLNAIVNNDILGYLVMVDDASFTALFNCIKNGIPMNITHTKDGHTYLYLDYQTLTPVINILSGIKVDLGGLSLDLAMIAEQWKLMQLFNLGLDLVPSTK